MRKYLRSAAVISGMVLAAGGGAAWAQGLPGATYDFSAAGGTLTNKSASGSYTDPANGFVCVGPNSDNCSSSGLFGSYTFGFVSPTESTITFEFSGSTSGSSDPFTIDLGNFVTTDGSTVDGITYDTGNLFDGDFTSVTRSGGTYTFTGTPDFGGFAGFGSDVTFDVSMTPAPEPASMTLLGAGLVGLGAIRRRRRQQG